VELQEHDIALLEAYLAGELAGEDLRACEARLQAEPALAETLALLRDLAPATAATAKGSLRADMKAAKAAAIAAGMASYTPAINAPAVGKSFLRRLIRFLFRAGLIGGAAWAMWKYVWHEKMPWDQANNSSSHSTTHTTITRDTVRHTDTIRYNGPAESAPSEE
jgi:anti-sigma factor RsiW